MPSTNPIDRRQFLIALLTAAALPRPASAGVADWFNGARVGAVLPQHDASFVQGAWDPVARLVMVDFWATWCAPCVTAIPHLNALQERFEPAGFQIIGISDEAIEVVTPFVTRKDMRYAVAAGGENPLRKALSIRALPYALLVDASRRIVWRGQPESLDDDALREHLAAASASAA